MDLKSYPIRSNNTNKFNPQELEMLLVIMEWVQIIQINSILKNVRSCLMYNLSSSNNTNKFNPQEPLASSIIHSRGSNNTNKFNPQEPTKRIGNQPPKFK